VRHFQTNILSIRSHHFDKPERKSKNPKRKRGSITPFGQPARGPNEEKILPHRRCGLNDDDLDDLLPKKQKLQ
jgi:hypothetical protein